MKNGQFPTVFKLADLNGKNGFKLDGEMPGDFSGSFRQRCWRCQW